MQRFDNYFTICTAQHNVIEGTITCRPSVIVKKNFFSCQKCQEWYNVQACIYLTVYMPPIKGCPTNNT